VVKPVASEIEIEATADRVWSLLTEFRHWPHGRPRQKLKTVS
jgi:hypothetical protein